MPINIETLPSPLFDEPIRSAIQLVRRMMLLRWSTGPYLTGVAGNYGLTRPPLGFSDDEVFRACAQALMGDYKTIGNAFWQLLEIILGAYEDLYYEVTEDYKPGDTVLHLRKYGDYIEYDPASKVGFPPGFTPAERVTSIHPATGELVEGLFLYDDIILNRLYLKVIASTDPDLTFTEGLDIVGKISGATLTPTKELTVIDLLRIPLYTRATVYQPAPFPANPLDVSLSIKSEETVLCTASSYLERIRVVNPMINSFSAGDMIFIPGGCWDFIQTEARKVKVRLLCEELRRLGLPGNSYVHKNPWREATLQTSARPGDGFLRISELELEDIAGLMPPNLNIIIDPENEYSKFGGGSLLVESVTYNSTTGIFLLSSPLPSGRFWPAGTMIKWIQSESGEVIDPAIIGQDWLTVRCRTSEVEGPWIIDEGGANEELVFFKKTSYQKRRLVGDIESLDDRIYIDLPFDPPAILFQHIHVTDEVLGYIGFVVVDEDHGNYLDLAVASTITTAIDIQHTIIELCDGPSFRNQVELTQPLTKPHLATESIRRYYGVIDAPAPPPVWESHLPDGGWPPPVPPAPPFGRWPGPNVFEPSLYGAINSDAEGLVSMELDRTGLLDPSLFDARVFMGVTYLSATFDPSTAMFIPLFGFGFGSVAIQEAPIYIVDVEDASTFPDITQMFNWVHSPNNPRPLYPLNMIMGAEGAFGRPPLYFWGAITGVGGKVTQIYVSGIQRVHLTGTKVAIRISELPVKLLNTTWGGTPDLLPQNGKVIVDFATKIAEDVDYDTVVPTTIDRGVLTFERSFIPEYAHDVYKVSDIDGTIVGVPVVRSDKLAIPRKDGYSFPFYLGGNAVLMRLQYLLNLVRAAGVQVEIFDIFDNLLDI